MNELVPAERQGVEAYRTSTNAAEICKKIVLETAMTIGNRKYVRVEGWQAIAFAHACAASSGDVEVVDGGVRAVGQVRRQSDGVVIAEAEGFVGKDEAVWFGGRTRRWKWGQKRGEKIWYDEDMPKRADYAIRAMAQTRAISRACRSAFAHVVVLMNAGLQTTPAEEVPENGFDDDAPAPLDAEFEDVSNDGTAEAAALAMIDALPNVAAFEKWRAEQWPGIQAVLDQAACSRVVKHGEARRAELRAAEKKAAEAPPPAEAAADG